MPEHTVSTFCLVLREVESLIKYIPQCSLASDT